jgi:uncharacterized protein
MSHSFVWVDIPVHDLDRAIRFYSAVLDGPVTREGGPGFAFGVFSHSQDDVGGCLYTPDDDNAPCERGPLVYFNTDGRLGEAVRAVAANGGRIVQAMHQIGPHGYRAIVLDSEGNRVALHSPTD